MPSIDKMKAKRDIKGLIKAFQGKKDAEREEAAWALGSIKDPAAVPALIDGLRGNSTIVCGATAKALGDIGDRSAVLPLIAALNRSSRINSNDMAGALGTLKDRSNVAGLITALQEQERGEKGARRLLMIEEIVKALAKFKDPVAIPAIEVTAKKSKSKSVRDACITALAVLKG